MLIDRDNLNKLETHIVDYSSLHTCYSQKEGKLYLGQQIDDSQRITVVDIEDLDVPQLSYSYSTRNNVVACDISGEFIISADITYNDIGSPF